MVNLKFFGNLTKEKKEDSKKPEEIINSSEEDHQKYGVRSYIDQFYQVPQRLSKDDYDRLFPHEANDSRCRRALINICRITSICGLLLIIAGAGAIIVGYTWTGASLNDKLIKQDIRLVQDAQGGIWLTGESVHKLMSDPWTSYKFIGLIVFTGGGMLLAASLLIPTCINWCTLKPPGFMSAVETPRDEETKSPCEQLVPVAGKICKIQPETNEERLEKTDEMILADETTALGM